MISCANLVGLSGLEPPTSRLSGVRSNRLSYRPIKYPSGLVSTIFSPFWIYSFLFVHIFRLYTEKWTVFILVDIRLSLGFRLLSASLRQLSLFCFRLSP